MIKESVTIDEAVEYLNSVLKADPLATKALLCTFIPCNETLADHPSTQVSDRWAEGYTVGLLGIINGMFGTDDDGWGSIASCFDLEDGLVGFARVDDDMKPNGNEEDETVL